MVVAQSSVSWVRYVRLTRRPQICASPSTQFALGSPAAKSRSCASAARSGFAWTAAREASGVRCRFHDLRHTVVTRLLEAGQPFAVVADIMGWSRATVVRMAKRYAHIGNSARRPAIAALDGPAESTNHKQQATAQRRTR